MITELVFISNYYRFNYQFETSFENNRTFKMYEEYNNDSQIRNIRML